MRTIIIIVVGLVVLALVAAGAWRFGNGAASLVTAVKVFIAVWLVAALLNMWLGVARAGYSVAEELPIFLVIFLVPAAVAVFLWWKNASS
jgi:hypothetical protein